MPKPTDVKALPSHRIWLRYDDGTEGEVDLSDLAGHGVFAAWNDAAFFNAVHLGSHGAIEWSPDLDLCPDAMYLRLTGKSVDEVFPDRERASKLQPLNRLAAVPEVLRTRTQGTAVERCRWNSLELLEPVEPISSAVRSQLALL